MVEKIKTLENYNQKRNFNESSEPEGKGGEKGKSKALRFVVQRHHASHLHYDFRLELEGVLKSWAVPKGPSMNPNDKRLAVMVEDHPIDYINFKGHIPSGNYGAGNVIVWDQGHYEPINKDHSIITEKEASENLKNGELKFRLEGKKLNGEFVLVRIHSKMAKENSWLLIKHQDKFSSEEDYNSEDSVLETVKKKTNKGLTNRLDGIKNLFKKGAEKFLSYYHPMLAGTQKLPFDDPDWIFEIKYDGYRAIAERNGSEIRLYSRNGVSFSNFYPDILKSLSCPEIQHDFVIDGEIVVLDDKGKPNFGLLQGYDELESKSLEYPLIYYVFDLLFLDQKDLRFLPLCQRKELLKTLLIQWDNDIIRYTDHIDKQGKAFFSLSTELHLEGIMAKKVSSIYRSGVRSKEWLKIKNEQIHEGIIIGYTKAQGNRNYFGSLLLADYRENKLKYMGNTGSGFSEKTLVYLWDQMQPLIISKSPIEDSIKLKMPVTWLEPRLRCQVKYTEQTSAGNLRHPVFLGLTEGSEKDSLHIPKNKPDKGSKINPKISIPMPTAKISSLKLEKNNEIASQMTIHGHCLELSHLDKLYWPKDNISKGQMLEYYQAVSPYLLPYLKNRPLSLRRNPNGILDEGFFHKNAGENSPKWINTYNRGSKESEKIIHYLVCNNIESLLYIINLGSIELNPWNSVVRNINCPSYLILDLDPSPGNNFQEVVETATFIHSILEKAGISCYPKTSGATGIHVYIPLGGNYTYVQSKDFAHLIAQITARALPKITSLERSLEKRGSKIYVDFLQNEIGQTVACAYSLRPKPGAPVSCPLHWKEVNYKLDPLEFNLHTMPRRIEDFGDLFKPILGKGINMVKALQELENIN